METSTPFGHAPPMHSTTRPPDSIAVSCLAGVPLGLYMGAPTATALPVAPQDFLVLIASALVGRLVLSLLPAGLPGEHRPQALAITWAASHALGGIALGAQARIFDVDLWSPQSAWLTWSPWLLLLALRLSSLPAGMRPRHRPSLQRAHWPAWLALGTGLLLVWRWAPGSTLGAADWLATLIVICHALREARLPPSAWCLVPLCAALYLKLQPGAEAPLAVALGAGFGTAWLLVADRRACLLACIGCASLWPVAPLLAGAGLLGLLALSRQPQRKYALVSSLVTSAFFAVTLLQ